MPLPKTGDFMISFFESDDYLPNALLSEDFMRAVKDSLRILGVVPGFAR